MNKLLIVTPNEQIYQTALDIVTEAYIEAKVVQASSDTVVELVKNEFMNAVGVVVARGNHAHLLKTQTTLPVVDIVLTGQEMAVLLEQACAMIGHPHPRIAFVGFRYMFSDCEPMARILQAEVDVYYASSGRDVPNAVDRAIQEGAELIIGGEIACRHARQKSVLALFMDSMKESIRNAVRSALHMMEALQLEQRKNAEFSTLLNNSFNALLKLDPSGKIEVTNHMAEKALRKSAQELVGTDFLSLPGLQPSVAQEDALSGHRSLYSTVLRMGRESYVANIASIDIDGRNDGFIVSMQEFGAIDDLEDTIRRERRHMGYVAHARFAEYNTHSAAMTSMLDDARQYAIYDVPLLLSGPQGTGKIRLAECIHNASPRQENPFVVIDLSVLSLQSQTEQIFGLDTVPAIRGLLPLAQKGTAYIDHADLLTAESQHHLYNVLCHGHYHRGTSQTLTPISVRLLFGTSRNLVAMAEEGAFLKPLAEMMSRMELRHPALRERAEDIPLLLDRAMAQAATKYKKPTFLTDDAIALLIHYDWPGNVGELEKLCEKATILAHANQIDAAFLQERVLPQRMEAQPQQAIYVVSNEEENALRSALRACGNDRQAAAEMLGISRSTLWRRMKKYSIEDA